MFYTYSVPKFLIEADPYDLQGGILHICTKYHNHRLDEVLVYCWGHNGRGQTDLPDLGRTQDLAAGAYTTCANSNGALICWGNNLNSRIPKEFKRKEANRRFHVSIGERVICASQRYESSHSYEHTLNTRCWGQCAMGQCDVPEVVEVNGTKVSAGLTHACAIVIGDPYLNYDAWSGSVECWGANTYGQLNVPGSFHDYSQAVLAGNKVTCAMRVNFYYKCWGNDAGDIPLSNLVQNFTRSIGVGGTHMCSHSGGVAQCWGNDWFGQSSLNDIQDLEVSQISVVEAGFDFTCYSTLQNQLGCFGFNVNGQSDLPAYLSLQPQFATQMSLGLAFSCVITDIAANIPHCWGGHNEHGQLDIPQAAQHALYEVKVGDEHACALQSPDLTEADWALYCWGSNEYGQTNVPDGYAARDDVEVYLVSTGGAHTCMKLDRPQVLCWGSNTHGQTKFNYGEAKVQYLGAGVAHTCIFTSEIHCYGLLDNYKGVEVKGNLSILAAGWENDCYVSLDGSLNCLGSNEYDQCEVPQRS